MASSLPRRTCPLSPGCIGRGDASRATSMILYTGLTSPASWSSPINGLKHLFRARYSCNELNAMMGGMSFGEGFAHAALEMMSIRLRQTLIIFLPSPRTNTSNDKTGLGLFDPRFVILPGLLQLGYELNISARRKSVSRVEYCGVAHRVARTVPHA